MNPTAPETTDKISLPAADRIQAVLATAFGGMHHVYDLKKAHEGTSREFWQCIHDGSLSTFDFNTLTRLVVAAHDFGVRVDISVGGPRRLKIRLHARYKREGSMFERHPTMAMAAEIVRGSVRMD